MTDEPSNQDMEVFGKMFPSIKRKMAEKAQESARKRLGNKRFCPICTNEIKFISKPPSQWCPDCQKKLAAGQSAIVSIDGRHCFIVSDGDTEAEKDLFLYLTEVLPKEGFPADFTIKGCVLPTTSEKMTFMEEQYKKQNERN